MITILFGQYHVEFPFPPTPLQLRTAIRMGLQQIAKEHEKPQFEGLQVRLSGERVDPKDAERIIADGAIISLIPVQIHGTPQGKVFVLEDD